MNNNELKPCPFCGGKAKIITYYPDLDYYEKKKQLLYILCESCRCKTGVYINDDTVDSALKAWNRRVNEDEIRSEEKMKRTYNSDIDNVIEEVRKAYEEGKNMSFIKDPIAYALWITWMAYEAKHEEQTRGD